MKKIAAISEKKIDDFSHLWLFENETIEVVNFGWKPRPKRTIKAVNNGNFIMLASSATLKGDIDVIPDIAKASGKLLQLAFLPQLLDCTRPNWREETIIVNSGSIAGRLAIAILLKETAKISISGRNAAQISASLFSKYGLITQPACGGFPIRDLVLPTAIQTEQGPVSIEVAEAVLATTIGYYPTVHPGYLTKLAAAAKDYAFYPSPTAAAVVVCK